MQSSGSDNKVIVEVFGCTDVGRAREHNEDAFAIVDLDAAPRTMYFDELLHLQVGKHGLLFMVADGMGGAAAGEVASAMAVESVTRLLIEKWAESIAPDASSFADSLREATNAANSNIHQFAVQHVEHHGMGTTATIAGLLGDTLFLSQVGDSRAYLARRGTLHQLTRDQSLMQRLVEAGELTPEEAEQSDRRNIILQALGPDPAIRSDISVQQIRQGDVLLLCSDGLSGVVRSADMERAIATGLDMEQVCRGLIALANERGGPDNITIIGARFSGSRLLPAEESDAIGYEAFHTEQGDAERMRFAATATPDNVMLHGLVRVAGEISFLDQPASADNSLVDRGDGEEEEISRGLTYGVVVAAAIGVAIILYRHFL